MSLEELKCFMRIDNYDDDVFLQSLITAAEEFLLSHSGIKTNYSSQLYILAIQLLVNHWYENRVAVLTGSISKNLEYSLNSILFALRYGGSNV